MLSLITPAHSDKALHMNTLKDRIWITAKTRMISERRYRRYELVSHILLAYLSFLLIASSLFNEDLSRYVPYFDKINIVISVFLFAASLRRARAG